MELLIGVLAIFVAFLLWLFSPEPLRRRFRRLFKGRPELAVEPDTALFDGRVEILTDKLLSQPADAIRVKQYYEGAPLDWDVIAADADVERDQQDDLIEQLSQPLHSLRLVCILGEPGSGKSTLAWRLAAELHKRHRALVIRVKDKEDPEVWYRMAEFCHRALKPFCVLADDLFRNPEVGRALRELNPSLPLAVLATSQSNEYRPGRLKAQVVPVPLRPPSLSEKERVLHRLGQDADDLSPERLKRLNAANEFLVLMMELTAGKQLQEIVQDSLENLLRLHEPVYRAYEYLCFTYSYGIAIPASVLERLDSLGNFHDLPNREGAQGLVFYDESRSELVRPGHPRRAETARRLFEKRRSSATVLQELAKAVDVSSPFERRFLAHLLRSLAYQQAEVLKEALPHIERKVTQCVQQASRISELTIWRPFYLALGRSDEADRCVDAALELEPISVADCNLALSLYRERGRERDALPILDRWIDTHPELGGGRPAYLGLVERYGSESDQGRAIDDASAWLATHPDDNYVRYVRTAYLGLVERKGTAEQTARVLEETSAWLATHAHDAAVRTPYLGLVERKGTAEQTARVLQETSAWLATHAHDAAVRTRYLGLVERKGTAEQTARVLQETSVWLATHPDDTVARTAYLGLVERKGTAKQTARVLQETSAWLATHPDDSAVRTAYLGLVERKGTAKQTARVLQETPPWLRAHPHATDVWARFISYLCALEKFDDARALAEDAVAIHSMNSNLVTHYLNLMQDRLDEPRTRDLYATLIKSFPGDAIIKNAWGRWLHSHHYWDEAEDTFKSLTASHPRSFQHWYSYGRLLLDMARYGEAADRFRQVLKIHKGHRMAHDGLALALHGLARREEEAGNQSDATRLLATVEREFRSAIHLAAVQDEPQAIFYTHLGWFYVDQNRWRDALGAFDQAANEDPDYFGNYWGQGRAFAGLEQWHDAVRVLRTALQKAPDTLEPPASDEIQQLIERCEAALTHSMQSAAESGRRTFEMRTPRMLC